MLGNLRDFRVDQPLGQREAVFVGERHQRALIDQRIEQRAEVADDAGIVGVRALLPRVLQPPLHRVAHFALGDFLVADLGERPAAHAEADLAGAEVGKVGDGEAGEDGDQHDRHDAGADLGL